LLFDSTVEIGINPSMPQASWGAGFRGCGFVGQAAWGEGPG